MINWLSLVTSLPTENATLRQRVWRALKASGAAVLRDGVYLMPEREGCRTTLESLAADIRDGGGTAHLLRVKEPEDADFAALFDRSREFAALLAEVGRIGQALAAGPVQESLRQTRKLRKAFANLVEIDFFPGEAQSQTGRALCELERDCARTLSPDEPQPREGSIARLHPGDYRNRIWATRQRPWVDRLASGWLIRRFIDREARIVWLTSPADCPADAVGFDFDGATFSHTGGLVTFEVLAASFGLDQPAVTRLGLLVHFLDVGGVQPSEAAGIESVLAGMRASIADDEQLLLAASAIFDGLLASFSQGAPTA